MLDDLVSALTALRNGEDGSHKAMVDHFSPLITEVEPYEEWGTLFLALTDAVDRLAKNAVEPQGLEEFIKAELRRGHYDYKRETSENVLPPSSTNATRRRNKSAPYTKLTRRRGLDQMPYDPDVEFVEQPGLLNTIPAKQTREDQTGSRYGKPSRMDESSELLDLREALDEQLPSAIEREVMDLLAQGHSRAKVGRELGLTAERVRLIYIRIVDRARRKLA